MNFRKEDLRTYSRYRLVPTYMVLLAAVCLPR